MIHDTVFKFYFSFFITRGKQGAEAAVLAMVCLLSLNEYCILLYISSLYYNLADLRLALLIPFVVVIGLNNVYLEHRYIEKGGFEAITIKQVELNRFWGACHFILSLLLTPMFLQKAMVITLLIVMSIPKNSQLLPHQHPVRGETVFQMGLWSIGKVRKFVSGLSFGDFRMWVVRCNHE